MVICCCSNKVTATVSGGYCGICSLAAAVSHGGAWFLAAAARPQKATTHASTTALIVLRCARCLENHVICVTRLHRVKNSPHRRVVLHRKINSLYLEVTGQMHCVSLRAADNHILNCALRDGGYLWKALQLVPSRKLD